MNYAKHTSGSRAASSRGAHGHKMSPDTLLQRARCDSSLKSIAFAGLRGTLETFADRMPTIIVLLVAGVLVWGTASALGSYLDMPDVHKSWLTQECVRVVNADGSAGSCEKLPKQYHLVWVE